MSGSGLDWSVSESVSKAAFCKSSVAEGPHTFARADYALHSHPSNRIFCRSPASVVLRRLLLIDVSWLNRHLRYIPPTLNTERSNIWNSQNTTLFGISIFQYIFSGIVLSVGPPFRQSMRNNCRSVVECFISELTTFTVPFIVTIVATSLFCAYMLLDPGTWLAHLMQLTPMPTNFKLFILVLAIGDFAFAWMAEIYIYPCTARFLGRVFKALRPRRKKRRKEYKSVLADLSM